MRKVLEPLNSPAAKAAREQASQEVASLSRSGTAVDVVERLNRRIVRRSDPLDCAAVKEILRLRATLKEQMLAASEPIDLTERLRDSWCWASRYEAANEIERLRTALATAERERDEARAELDSLVNNIRAIHGLALKSPEAGKDSGERP